MGDQSGHPQVKGSERAWIDHGGRLPARGTEEGWSLMIFSARATRCLRRVGGGTVRPSFLLAEAARSECAPSMRAVKDSLAVPLGLNGENRKALAQANGTSRGIDCEAIGG